MNALLSDLKFPCETNPALASAEDEMDKAFIDYVNARLRGIKDDGNEEMTKIGKRCDDALRKESRLSIGYIDRIRFNYRSMKRSNALDALIL